MTDVVDAPTSNGRLSKRDWVEAALKMLVDDGIDAVQITRLSRNLAVTRGSFYWHFSSREDLLRSMISEWRSANSGIMAAVLEKSETLTGGILSLFSMWVEDEQFSPLLDQAIRDWARLSDDIGKIVREEDRARIETIARFFFRFDYGKTEALVRARVLYFTQIGYYALNMEDSMTARMGMLDAYFKTFTGCGIDVTESAQFRSRLLVGESR